MPASGSVSGAWTAELSGGCPKHPTWPDNPQYVITPAGATSVTIDLTQLPAAGTNLVPIGIAVLHAQTGVPLRSPILSKQVVGKSKYKSVRTQSLKVDLKPLPTNKLYVIVPMTFEVRKSGHIISNSDEFVGALSRPPARSLSHARFRAPPQPGQLCTFELAVTSEDSVEFSLKPHSVSAVEPLAAQSGTVANAQRYPPTSSVAAAAPAKSSLDANGAPPVGLSAPVPAVLSEDAAAAAAADPTLARAIEAFTLQSKTSDGPWEDAVFALNAAKGGSKGVTDNSLLYLSGQVPPG